MLEKLYGDAIEPYLDQLAYHSFMAAPGGDVEKAMDYAVKAAERASRLLAYEDAAMHYERALQALDLMESTDESRKCALWLALGFAQNRAGNVDKAREVLIRAAGSARKLKDWVQLARAAQGLAWGAGLVTRYGKLDHMQVELLQEALNGIGDTNNPLRARLLAQLSLALYSLADERRTGLAEEAVQIARAVNDKPALMASLYSQIISLEGFEQAEERLALATEIVWLAEQTGDVKWRFGPL